MSRRRTSGGASSRRRDNGPPLPEWMAHETPHQRAAREGTEARRRLRAERMGREYVPIWVQHPEVTPVYADDGRLVSWRESEREQAQHRAEVEAVTEVRALDWIDTAAITWDGLNDERFARLGADELLGVVLQAVQTGELPPETIRDEYAAKSEALHPLHRLDERGSVVTDPWSLVNG